MLCAILALVACQFLGDVIAKFLAIPVPGVIIGLVLLLIVLAVRGRLLGPDRAVPEDLARIAKALHDHFGLLFVPAGVGVMADFGRLAADAGALIAVVIVSTAGTILVTVLVTTLRRGESRVPAAVEVP